MEGATHSVRFTPPRRSRGCLAVPVATKKATPGDESTQRCQMIGLVCAIVSSSVCASSHKSSCNADAHADASSSSASAALLASRHSPSRSCPRASSRSMLGHTTTSSSSSSSGSTSHSSPTSQNPASFITPLYIPTNLQMLMNTKITHIIRLVPDYSQNTLSLSN